MILTYICVLCGYMLIKEENDPLPVVCLMCPGIHRMELESKTR